MTRSAWLIESSAGWYVRQWDSILSWTRSPSKALHFSEKEEAERLIATRFDGHVQAVWV